jgi:hypothetical protein
MNWYKYGRAQSCMCELVSEFPFKKLGELICLLSLPTHYYLVISGSVVGVTDSFIKLTANKMYF